MNDSASIASEIVARFEGCELEAYQCPSGVWTIGYGHTRNVKNGWECSQIEADMMLRDDLEEFSLGVVALVKVRLTDNQMAALISFAYNCGLSALASSTLLRLVNEGNHSEARKQFQLWVNSNGRTLLGLVRRRKAEAELYAKPDTA